MALCPVTLRRDSEPSAPAEGPGSPHQAPNGLLAAPPPQLPLWPMPGGLGLAPMLTALSCRAQCVSCPARPPICTHQHHSVVSLPQLWHGHVPAHDHAAVEGAAVRAGRLGKGVDDILWAPEWEGSEEGAAPGTMPVPPSPQNVPGMEPGWHLGGLGSSHAARWPPFPPHLDRSLRTSPPYPERPTFTSGWSGATPKRTRPKGTSCFS